MRTDSDSYTFLYFSFLAGHMLFRRGRQSHATFKRLLRRQPSSLVSDLQLLHNDYLVSLHAEASEEVLDVNIVAPHIFNMHSGEEPIDAEE